ncbi:MAG TPA: superoxide dismutase family protein [Gemmatimonadaceae bacterium]
MTRSILRVAVVVAFLFVVSSCAHAPSPLNRVGVAYVTFADAAGAPRGTAELWQDTDNVVHVQLQLLGLPAGTHGIHFHAVGRCEGSGTTPFSTAGSHFNPLGRQHGLENPAGPHGGDLPNIVASNDGSVSVGLATDRVSLTAGSTTLFDADGTAMVIHAAADDQVSQPAGNSGARIACGVVRRTL